MELILDKYFKELETKLDEGYSYNELTLEYPPERVYMEIHDEPEILELKYDDVMKEINKRMNALKYVPNKLEGGLHINKKMLIIIAISVIVLVIITVVVVVCVKKSKDKKNNETPETA